MKTAEQVLTEGVEAAFLWPGQRAFADIAADLVTYLKREGFDIVAREPEKTDNVVRLDLTKSDNVPPEQVISDAKKEKFASIMVIGELEDGEFYRDISLRNMTETLYLLRLAEIDANDEIRANMEDT